MGTENGGIGAGIVRKRNVNPTASYKGSGTVATKFVMAATAAAHMKEGTVITTCRATPAAVYAASVISRRFFPGAISTATCCNVAIMSRDRGLEAIG